MRSMAAVLGALVVLFVAQSARAERRIYYEDAVVVERSELIVVAHLKEGSIKHVLHQRHTDGQSWEHHATLVITKVLKGKCSKKAIPLILYFGITPTVGGHLVRDNSEDQAGKIEIFDTSRSKGPSFVEDARQDNLWFLQKRGGLFGRDVGRINTYGVADPEEMQPLTRKDYFAAYLSEDPETALRKYAQGHPEFAARAQQYLDYIAVRRIERLGNREERCRKLLPFFLKRSNWGGKYLAQAALVRCGDVAGEKLQTVFDDSQHVLLRREIIDTWQEMRYRNAVPVLIDQLNQHNKFWADQKLPKNWWNADSKETELRQRIFSEDNSIVRALGSFKELTSEDILIRTRDLWKKIEPEGGEYGIAKSCETALREIALKYGMAP